jgi:hypothetical protein
MRLLFLDGPLELEEYLGCEAAGLAPLGVGNRREEKPMHIAHGQTDFQVARIKLDSKRSLNLPEEVDFI